MDMLHSMQIFVNVVRHGSFIKAANAMQIHRPNVTREIKNLESSLGVRLLHRSTRKQSMTEDGQVFFERCVQILEAVQETKQIFSESRDKPCGRLRLDFPVPLAKSVIIPALWDFQRLYPDIELVVGTGDQAVDLIADGIDCVVRIGKIKESSLVARRIGSVGMITCASPAYLAQNGTPRTLEDLPVHKAINYFSDPDRKILEWLFRVGKKEVPIRMRSGLLVNDSETMVAAAIAGFGLVQAVDTTVQQHLASGRLVAVLSDIPTVPKSIWVMFPHRHNLRPQVRAFLEWVPSLFPTSP